MSDLHADILHLLTSLDDARAATPKGERVSAGPKWHTAALELLLRAELGRQAKGRKAATPAPEREPGEEG